MESIKNKMEQLVEEKQKATETAEGLEADKVKLEERCQNFERSIDKVNKDIANLENELDTTVTATIAASESLESASITASDFELEVSALVRRVQLLEEETTRVNERLNEVVAKLTVVEKEGEDHERTRKILEAKSFTNEEQIELGETQCEEAKTLAEESDRKYEEICRKLRIVENDLERINERAEDFESKISGFETKIEGDRNRLNEFEKQAGENAEKEDKLEDEVRRLSEVSKNEETRAEFAERTVEKLETNIDILQDGLYNEKAAFIDLSKKLDATLNDMMSVQ
jgi:chromosome segregation ATPase